ncbi:MAG: glycosyltransferase [Cyanophyceae cyanobacterium]
MIVVTLGTSLFPFERAVDWLQKLLNQKIIDEPVLFQHGSTLANNLSHPLLTSVVSLSNSEMTQSIRQASFIISHAGQGSTRLLAEMKTSFVLLPRLKCYGEHVDDHQLLFARAVEKFGVCYCTEFEQLANYVKHRPTPFSKELFTAPLLVDHLVRQYSNTELSTQIQVQV